MSSKGEGTPPQPIWDLSVRLLHWALVALAAAAWFTRETRGPWHERIGYGVAVVVVVRIVWGFVGSRRARFADFVRGPSLTLPYARAVLAGRAPRYVGHNPLGGWMVVALLSTAALLCLSGWLFTTDWLWGYAWLANTHAALAWLLIALAALHVAGVILTSRHQRENLVRSMVDGRKRPPGPGEEG